MSKHKTVDGRLLQMDKSFGQLKQKQREKIAEWMYQAYKKQVKEGLSEDDAPSFDDFLTWFWSNEGNHTYTWVDQYGNDQTTSLYWVPVGEIWPLLVIALLYALFLAIKSGFFKSLLTAKRSE